MTPVGVLLVVAALRADPGQAQGLDQLVRDLADSALGRAVVSVVSAGFLVFAGYSLLEAGYRRVHAGE